MKYRFFLLLAIVAALTFAQQKDISGTVTSKADGTPIPGVSVLVVGTTSGTVTDFDGNYTLSTNTGDVLQFSFVGMQNASITVGNNAVINVQMEEDVSQLEEVVVTALGIERKRKQLGYSFQDVKGRVYHAATRFLRRLSDRTGVFLDKGFPTNEENAKIEVSFKTIAGLNINTDESYTLSVKTDKITIHANTDIGAMRGLETLLQLIDYDSKSYYFVGAEIEDAPRFPWRGLMIDVARHFQPVDVLKRNLDAMASVKLNVFHWHLSDDQGFRIESKIYPKLHELASDGQYYTHEQIKDVVQYAANLGIRVVPEIDIPGHATAILTAHPELASKENYTYTIERYAGIFDPTLNPIKEITYHFLENLFTEITPFFPDAYFHIGGDENEGKHWDENPKIQAFKAKHGFKNNHELQNYFNIRIEKTLHRLGKKMMGWDEILTPDTPKSAMIHSWRGPEHGLKKSSLLDAAQRGHLTVLSKGYYIDLMLSVKEHYLVDPIADLKLTKEERKRILGAEATMWSELVTPLTIDSRIWPRTAAIAERFWSEKDVNDVSNMLKRLKVVSYQLEELGITHIKNKEVILRMLTDNQSTESLKILSNICEPLKMYTRNKGGAEYKSFSPFTLFADACSADASVALIFNALIDDFVVNPDEKSKLEIASYLKKWVDGYQNFKPLTKNPKLSQIEPLYSTLAETASILKKGLESPLSDSQKEELEKQIQLLKKPCQDVALVIVHSLEKLKSIL
jgi:hexosaminidase